MHCQNITHDIFQNYITYDSRDCNMDNLLLHALNKTVALAVDRAEVEAEDDFTGKNTEEDDSVEKNAEEKQFNTANAACPFCVCFRQ